MSLKNHPNAKHQLKSLKWWLTSRAPGKSKPFPLKIAKLPQQTISSSNHWFLNFQVILFVLGRVTSWGILLISKVRHSTDFWFWNIQPTAKPSQKTGWMISGKKKTCQIIHHSVVSKGEVSRSNSKNHHAKEWGWPRVHMICASFSPCYVDWNANYFCRVTLFFPSCFTFAQLISGSSIQICDFSIYLLKSWEILCFLPSPEVCKYWQLESWQIGLNPLNTKQQTRCFLGCILKICAKKCHVRCWVKDFEYPILWRKQT